MRYAALSTQLYRTIYLQYMYGHTTVRIGLDQFLKYVCCLSPWQNHRVDRVEGAGERYGYISMSMALNTCKSTRMGTRGNGMACPRGVLSILIDSSSGVRPIRDESRWGFLASRRSARHKVLRVKRVFPDTRGSCARPIFQLRHACNKQDGRGRCMRFRYIADSPRL